MLAYFTYFDIMQHFRSIHYLRGIAAVIVVIFHICTTFRSLDPNLAYTFWLQSGVDIFFVISGFVMIKSTSSGTNDIYKFILDRAIRIIPIYWAITLFIILISKPDIGRILTSLFFVPVHDSKTGDLISAIIPPAWTLNLEIFFYLIFAALLKLSTIKKLISVVIIFVALIMVGRLSSSHTLGFYTNPIIIDFWLGMVLARYHHLGRAWMVPIGIASLCLSASPFSFSFLPFTPGAFLVVAGMVAMENRMKEWRSFRVLGDASYVLYLVHMVMIFASYAAFGHLLTTAPTIFFVATLLLCISTALLVHRFVEKPMIAFIKARLLKRTNITSLSDATSERRVPAI